MDEQVRALTQSEEAAERYQCLCLIGEGGMSRVYKLLDTLSQQPVAIKVLRNELTFCEMSIIRFIREAKILGKLDHPHIVKVFDWKFSLRPNENNGYFIMEYMDNGSLRQEIKHRLEQAHIWNIGDYVREVSRQLSVCEALSYIHNKGIIARDLKPDHFLFNSQGQVKLIDFGIIHLTPQQKSKIPDPFQTEPGAIIGTPRYMSPEQANGEDIDHRADIYSFGIVLYELFTQETPFTAGNILDQHVHDTPIRPRTFNPTIPAVLEEIILMCLEKNPDNRPPNALVLKKHFEEFLQHCQR